jgi:hypothetical protein
MVDELAEQVKDLPVIQTVAGQHRLGRRQRPAAAEDRQAPEDHAFGVAEQVVAPVQRGPHGPVPFTPTVASGGERVQPALEPAGQLLEWKTASLSRRQLDGEGNAVEAAADLLDRFAVIGTEGDAGMTGPVDEQVHGARLGVQRRHGDDGLAIDAQGLAGAGQDPQPSTAGQGLGDERRRTVQYVLAVVEDQEDVSVPEALDDGLLDRASLAGHETERA